MKTKIYIETTIPSYLAACPSRDLVTAAHQQITHHWWRTPEELLEVESIKFFTHKELKEWGVEATLLADPDYVNAAPLLEDVEYFDSGFFGYTPREKNGAR